MTIEILNPERIPHDFAIFYCWQDHLDAALHRYLIRDSLNLAIAEVQEDLPVGVDCNLRLDQATEARAGAVAIADVILEKIRNCSMLVADVTPVFADFANNRHYPNPNVMLEVGYGAKSLGWHRINCVFNSAIGDGVISPESLPFDVRHRRVSPFLCENRSGRKVAKAQLSQLLASAIRATIFSIDRGEVDLADANDAIRHQRDLRIVRELMRTVHRPTMDIYIERGSVQRLHYDCIYFWQGFDALVCSSFFRLYDQELQRLVLRLHEVWGAAMYHGGYAFSPGTSVNSWVLKPRHQWEETYEETIQELSRAYAELPAAWKNMLDYVHANFIEIDMDQTDHEAYEINRPYIESTHSSEVDHEATEEGSVQ